MGESVTEQEVDKTMKTKFIMYLDTAINTYYIQQYVVQLRTNTCSTDVEEQR